MKNYLMVGGVNSADYEIYIADKNQFAAPARDVEEIKVAGLNGNLHLDNGRFENQPLTYLLYIKKNLRANIDAFKAVLMNSSGYKKIQDTFNPEEYYQAAFTGGFDVDDSDKYRASFKITFDRMPQRFLVSGETPVSFTAAGAIKNPTQFESKPLIRAYGTGSMTINGATMTINSANSYTDLDCRIQEAYKGSTNCNDNVSGTFPSLAPGVNNISFTGFTKLEITPNWWTI